MKLDVK